MPSEFSEKFDSIDMDIRINELLDRLDILEENSSANTNSPNDEQLRERFPNNNPDTSSFDFNEFPGVNNQGSATGERPENSIELNKVPSPDQYNRFESTLNKAPPVYPLEKSVGSRVDELLKTRWFGEFMER